MDEALRRLERGSDPLAHAVALRRTGKELEARRLIEERVRAGDEPARTALVPRGTIRAMAPPCGVASRRAGPVDGGAVSADRRSEWPLS